MVKIEGTMDEVRELMGANNPVRKRRATKSTTKTKVSRKGGGSRAGSGLPKKYAKMGFSKGWKAYKKTPAYKKKAAAKKKKR